VCVVLAFLTSSVYGRGWHGLQNQQPVFRSGTEIVQLDVSVLDKARQPVRGLAAADFTILEDGKPQRVDVFVPVELPEDAGRVPAWMTDVTKDVTTNEIDNHRIFVLVLDDASLPKDLWAVNAVKQSALSFVNRLGADDLAAVLFTRDGRHSQNLTSDHGRLVAAINTLNPLAKLEAGCLAQVYSLNALVYTADYLAAVPQRRKTVLYFSEGAALNFVGSNECNSNWLTRELVRKAQQANVNIYPIDPMGLRVDSHTTWKTNNLWTLANETGGRAIINTNDFEPGLTQIMRENSAYYVLGYRPANVQADGTFRRLDVKVNRPDVEVWTRKNYYAPTPPPVDKPMPSPGPAVEALAGILPRLDLPLRVALAPFAGRKGSGSDSTVAVALGLRQSAQSERTVEQVEVVLKAFTSEGEARGAAEQTVTINVPAARRGAEFSRYDVLTKIDLKPGRYELRLSAHSAASGQRGSVYAEIEVPDFAKAPLSLSGAAIETVPGAPAAPLDSLAAILPIVPTTEREFTRATRVAAFLRVYQGGKATVQSATLAIRILDRQGVTAFERIDALSADRFSAGRAADVKFDVPIMQLVPGDYVLRFDAALGKTTGRRDVRFSIR
jgi:VWFA-related protein